MPSIHRRSRPSHPALRRRVILCFAIAAVWLLPALPQARSVAAAGSVWVYEQELALRSYDWRPALVPAQPDDAIYPYARLDFDKVGPVKDITTTVVVLESPSLRLTIAPEFGGRILRWYDKHRQRELLYVNPVLKPTRWGYRGWWFATGGIEWAFPTHEHGLNEWEPWQFSVSSGSDYAAVTVFDHEDRTGLDVSVTIALYIDGRVSFRPRIANRTDALQTFQFWINAMIPFSPDLQFDLPARRVEIHSTGDARLPPGGRTMPWPLYDGRDFSVARTWRQYLGVFAAPALYGQVSVRNPSSGARVTRIFPHTIARGVKLFLLGDLPSSLYTDGDSRYVELWGGYTRTFDENATLAPGQTISWREWWSIQ